LTTTREIRSLHTERAILIHSKEQCSVALLTILVLLTISHNFATSSQPQLSFGCRDTANPEVETICRIHGSAKPQPQEGLSADFADYTDSLGCQRGAG